MRLLRALPAGTLLVLLTACGSGQAALPKRSTVTRAIAASTAASASARAPVLPSPQALVTDETQNRLLVVDLPGGHIARRVPLPADPEDIAAGGDGGIAMVVSSSAGTVTVLDRATLRPINTFVGFDEPHIIAIAPDRRYAYVTDDIRGTLTVIRLRGLKVMSTITVGAGAHHLTFNGDHRRVWIALGESASQITILDSTDPAHPHVICHFSPGFPAHDLSFSPDGRRVWISSAAGPDVTAFDARTRRVLFRVPVGAPPQHLDLEGHYAYLTSGYGGTIEKVDAGNGRMIARASAPYGSFELAAADGYVATASLLRGTLAIYTLDLKLLHVVKLAPATREVAISRP